MNRITWTEPAIDWAIGDKTISLGRYWCWSSIWDREVKEREGMEEEASTGLTAKE